MKFKQCKGCGIKKETKFYGKIWLSDDGYCSVCNAKYKDRPRAKPIFDFKIIKEGNYDHLNQFGVRESEYIKLRKKVEKKYNVNAAPSITHQLLEKRKKRIIEFL